MDPRTTRRAAPNTAPPRSLRHAIGALLALAVLAAGCSKDPEPPARPAGDGDGARAVTVTRVVLEPLAGTLTASGLLVPREEATVGSEIAGYRVAEVRVDEGATVRRGQVLARLDPGLLSARLQQADAALAQARAQARQARAEAARVDGLDGTGILSDEQIGSRRAQAAGADAAVAVAQAQLDELRAQRARLEIRAPVDGTVLERMVRPGDVATASQPMFRIARGSLIELDAEVPEGAIAAIDVGDAATVSLASGRELEGRARRLSPRVDPQTKLGRVRVELPVDAALRAGGYAHVVFRRDAQPVPAVPEKAVLFEAGGPLLIVIDDADIARRVPITTGARADGFVELVEGPPVGTRVALGGGAFLLDGDAVVPVQPPGAASAASAPRRPARPVANGGGA